MKLMDYISQHFGVTYPGDVTWSHAVNSTDKLQNTLSSPEVMIIESDISMSSNGIPVAVHSPETESDLSFEQLITQVQQSNKGIKFDFKDPEILIECLQFLKNSRLTQPIILNADILQGNNADISKFNPTEFISLCKKYVPTSVLSIGWTTTADTDYGYTQYHIDEMKKLSETLEEVTYPVRACLLPNSWKYITQLIQNNGHTITIWNNEPIDDSLKEWIRVNTDPSKTFYDFIDENMEPLKLV